ncbi:tetratricopeptide repeat protein [Oscillatoriales cyanobacterium LEGE 11467]|uniref:protein O-GlcNAc transferase n=1 Tax=Zarconia navalis LEGE 11467 TaxID=1828826 RepID=A0A928W0R1_9CYAN|nr:tetratricopeptide repeat protein [Zarconia navalis]MBE9041758.1 tetratricopeptide repeat protein [Zarconia navalis LEGE 11467]
MLVLKDSINTAIQEYKRGNLVEAQTRSEEILEKDPHHIDILMLLAAIAQKKCQFDRAESLYRQIIEIQPDGIMAYGALGDLYLLRYQNRWQDAIEAYQKVLTLNPSPKIALITHNYLGKAFIESGKIKQAIAAYQQVTQIQPNISIGHYNLGNALAKDQQFDEAIEAYQKAISLREDYYEAYSNLGNLLKAQGRCTEAIAAYKKAMAIEPNFERPRFGTLTSQIPIIYQNIEEIEASRKNYSQYLQVLVDRYQNATSEERAIYADAVGTSQPFYLAYQGLNDRHLQQQYGQAIVSLMHSRYPQWSQPPMLPPLQTNEKIRVGIVSAFFHSHSNWKIPIQGWVENIDRSRFELFGYYCEPKPDIHTKIAARSFDQFEMGQRSLEQWCQQIESDRLHVLIFPEFGMSSIALQLGCLRLAPIQMTSWGHPQTSGLSTIDYYLSSDLMEPENAAKNYTEDVVRLPNLSIFYAPLKLKPIQISRSDIGTKDDDILFWCCQSIYKYLPQDDDVFPKIARSLPNSKFIFIQHSRGKYVTDIFYERLRRSFAQFGLDSTQYCVFLPRMKTRVFAGASALADVFLDSIGWSGCNSTLESLDYNLPIVTLPRDLMRGRHTLAVLKMMGIEETIAADKDDYIKIAIRLGRDFKYRQAISEKVAVNKHRVYRDLEPVRALEDFLARTVGQKIDRPGERR